MCVFYQRHIMVTDEYLPVAKVIVKYHCTIIITRSGIHLKLYKYR